MYKRYHKKVYFPESDKASLIFFTNRLNTLKWKYTSHSLAKLKYRVIDTYSLLDYIKGLSLSYEQIFEYYRADNRVILKVCYRVEYKEYDFILVLSESKHIITIFINSKNDKHDALRKEIYCNK